MDMEQPPSRRAQQQHEAAIPFNNVSLYGRFLNSLNNNGDMNPETTAIQEKQQQRIPSFQMLCRRLERNDSRLVVVNCSRFTMGEVLIDTLLTALEGNTVAKTLILPLYSLTPRAAQMLAKSLPLLELRFVPGENCETGDVLIRFFRQFAASSSSKTQRTTTTLQHISLRGTRLDRCHSNFLSTLSYCLRHCSSLKGLDLCRTGFTNRMLTFIMPSMVESPGLQHLNLSFNHIHHGDDHQSSSNLARNFLMHKPYFQFLDVSYNVGLGQSAVMLWADALSNNNHYEETNDAKPLLHLRLGPLSNVAMATFFQQLPRMKRLRVLEIADASTLDTTTTEADAVDGVWSCLRHGITHNTTLESLILCDVDDRTLFINNNNNNNEDGVDNQHHDDDSNHISGSLVVAQSIAGGLLSHTNNTTRRLRHLALPHCHLTARGVGFLIDAMMTQNTGLVSLELQHNHLGDRGAMRLGIALGQNASPHLKSLLHLNVCDNKIGHEGVHSLVESMRYNQHLVSLEVSSGNPGATRERIQQITFQTRLNRIGRQTSLVLLLCMDNNCTPPALWPYIITRLSKLAWKDVLAYLIRENPTLFKTS